jgi:hypothetical protein
MNAQVRSELLQEPRPADADWCGVVFGPGDRGWRLSWLRQGRIEQPFGPVFLHVSEAAAAAHLLRQAHLLEPIEWQAPGLLPPALAPADPDTGVGARP